MVRLAHIWSSDMGIAGSLPQLRYFLGGPWEVTAICPDGPRLDAVRAAGVRWLPLSLTRRLIDPAGDARAALELIRYCSRERFDLVHTHNIKSGLMGRVIAGIVGRTKIVHTMHGMPFSRETPLLKRAGHAALEWAASRFADRILVQSEEDEQTMRRLVPARLLVRIGNGVPLDRFDPERVSGAAVRAEVGAHTDDVVFVYGGRLVREKGVLDLAQATTQARARDPRIKVLIAGPIDPEKADCLSAADLDRVRAAGVILLGERDDMPEVLAAADVVVLVSYREGLPRLLMEGAAMGKALLATDVRGCREIVDDPRGGALVPPRSPGALADAMLALAADGARRRAAGELNRRRALAEYDVRRVADLTEQVYRELLA